MVTLRVALSFLPLEREALSWPMAIAVAILGFVGLLVAPRAGFPDLWTQEVSEKQRFLIPALVGLGMGMVIIVLDLIQPLGEIHAPFPASLAVYGFAALFEEILLRLFLTAFLVWLVSTVILRGRAQATVFWVVAVGVAVFYLLIQLNAYATFVGQMTPVTLAQMVLVIGVAFVLAAYLFRRGGFLSPLMMRLVFYLVWHIIWGAV